MVPWLPITNTDDRFSLSSNASSESDESVIIANDPQQPLIEITVNDTPEGNMGEHIDENDNGSDENHEGGSNGQAIINNETNTAHHNRYCKSCQIVNGKSFM